MSISVHEKYINKFNQVIVCDCGRLWRGTTNNLITKQEILRDHRFCPGCGVELNEKNIIEMAGKYIPAVYRYDRWLLIFKKKVLMEDWRWVLLDNNDKNTKEDKPSESIENNARDNSRLEEID